MMPTEELDLDGDTLREECGVFGIYAPGADAARVREVATAVREQRRREQLIFARWTLVMLHFEKALYENPRQDLNRRWWDDVERFAGEVAKLTAGADVAVQRADALAA
mgnify:CR=1 FL=1